ncbi:dienelactone hydrolase family protein [Lentiprolixibacter aurantiacus]|uniref:Dienelactone hydrolase family protein n=1 Tax=Lentiprolixibacter aurantiacus TaxID=2993939 RepID=A0AAE3MN00_9FLAO|nr:alpha/beta family hydrolase [Lentiprolixibacter aurantiacus]MCX2720770.1 dienelactone hydrolase family protein [Lentiprolixibacter aurantiacus]
MKIKTTPIAVSIALGTVSLKGILCIPDQPRGIILFSHGSGSSRLSSRNNYVASILQEEGMATLLFDLLTEQEDLNYETRFDIPLLTQRLIAVTHWIKAKEETRTLKVAYFGASTGAASALGAAAYFGKEISAVVSRGGRPDLALKVLPEVKAPTLLLVGSRDRMVIGLNERAYDQLPCTKRLEIVEGASHLFEEPGKLEEVALLSAKWFTKYFK